MTTIENRPALSDGVLTGGRHRIVGPFDPDAPLRVGIVNLMPHAEQYEHWLLPPLTGSVPLDVAWIRVASRSFSMDDPARIERVYRTYEQAQAEAPLDALIVSGAAVEHLPYAEVRFLAEVNEIVQDAVRDDTPILGLCWGAMAVPYLLYGLPKRTYEHKVSGIYETDRTAGDDNPIVGGLDDRFWTAHSRFAGLDDDALDSPEFARQLRTLARAPKAGTVIAESLDHGVVVHIGHPEYSGGRLRDEYNRDVAANVAGVGPPANVDLARPANLWRSQSLVFFSSWLRFVGQRAAERR